MRAVLLALMAAWLLVSLFTMGVTPIVWQDEVQNIDLARTTLFERGSDWSINWHPDGRPERCLPYLAISLQEASYRLTGTRFAPRLISIIAAFLAAGALFRIFCRRGIDRVVALALSAAFLLDPIFVQSYRGGRVDSLAMALALAALLLMVAGVEARTLARNSTLAAASGVAMASALFCWPSSIFLAPLVFLPLAGLATTRPRDCWRPVLLFSAGGLAFAGVCVLPVKDLIPQLLSDFAEEIGNDRSGIAGRLLQEKALSASKTFLSSPIILVFAAAGGIVRPSLPLLAASAIAILMVLMGSVYTHRLLYLLPYLFVLAGGLFEDGQTAERGRRSRIAAHFLLVGLVVWALAVSAGARTAKALVEWRGRSHARAVEIAQTVGRGEHRVYTPYQLYFAGRAMGWRMFREAGPHPQTKERLFHTVDYAILTPIETEGLAASVLARAGLRHCMATGAASLGRSSLGGPFGTGGSSAYGPFHVYARDGVPCPPGSSPDSPSKRR